MTILTQPGGGMIESISIECFRCFEKLKVSKLGKINVVVGENASGKTAFLEAVFGSQMQSPELAVRYRKWRGVSGDTVELESLWRDLLYQFDQSNTIRLEAKGTDENTRTVTITSKPEGALIPFDATSGKESLPLNLGSFSVEDNTGQTHRVEFQSTAGGLRFKPLGLPSLAAFYNSVFIATTPAAEAATQFSSLSKKGTADKLVRLIQSVFPFVEDVSTENTGGNWMLHAKVPQVTDRIPLGLVSTGVQKLSALLTGIANQEHGVVLIDEIENGFHFSTLGSMWAALAEASNVYDVQLFLSTHSHECLQALLPIIEANEKLFRLIRLERKNGKHVAKVFAGKNFKAALIADIEIR